MPATNVPVTVASAHTTAPATVTTVRASISGPMRNRVSSEPPSGRVRNSAAWAATSTTPYRAAPSSSSAARGSTVRER